MQHHEDDTARLGAAPVAIAPLVSPDRTLHSDPHDFAGLYIRHRSSFTLHARRYLRDPRDADEVVQEAFLRLFLALPELETELQALAYCRRTITNLCIDRYRAQARRPRLVDLESVSAEDLADEDPGDPVVRAEDAALVRDALSMLSPLHRAALVKREIEEKPLPVIAEELEIAEDSVKHVLFRARRALRRLLAATSLAPGGEAEGAGVLGLAKAGSNGLAALLVLVVLGVGSGPDLRAIPVVGSDLPDLPGVTEFAKVVGEAVTDVSRAVSESVSSAQGGDDAPGGPSGADAPEPVPGTDGEASPSPSNVAPHAGTAVVDPTAPPVPGQPGRGTAGEPGTTGADQPVGSPSASPSPAPADGEAEPESGPERETGPKAERATGPTTDPTTEQEPEPARTQRPGGAEGVDGSVPPVPTPAEPAPLPVAVPDAPAPVTPPAAKGGPVAVQPKGRAVEKVPAGKRPQAGRADAATSAQAGRPADVRGAAPAKARVRVEATLPPVAEPAPAGTATSGPV